VVSGLQAYIVFAICPIQTDQGGELGSSFALSSVTSKARVE
jgi:hypothetical protein